MANYVKFMRGTPEQYLMLANKDADTIYFISAQDSTTGSLYIGEKRVGTNIEQGEVATKLSELSDVNLTDLQDGQILAWNATNAKWMPLTIPTFVGATETTPGVKGMVPMAKAGDHTKFLKGDGTWAELPTLIGLTYKVVESIDDIDITLPDAEKYIYLVKNGDIYDEYLVVEGKKEKIGDSAVELEGYMTTAEYEADITVRLNDYINKVNYNEQMLSIDDRLGIIEKSITWSSIIAN